MAQKRMFDKAIIDTDRFMDLSMSAKALYFLLGIEADDEGFVSYKKVMRVHGGNEDDIKVLVAKRFLLLFQSGVVVITDWNTNNYLDKKRVRQTEYLYEKSQLVLTSNKKYEFNNRLKRIEEYSIEENPKIQETTANADSFKIEPDTDYEVVPEKPKAQKDPLIPKYEDLLRWSESRRGFPFVGRTKQYAAFKKARASNISITRLKDRWQELEGEPWRDGFDWTSVLSTFDKRA